jgi:hypothetical protein
MPEIPEDILKGKKIQSTTGNVFEMIKAIILCFFKCLALILQKENDFMKLQHLNRRSYIFWKNVVDGKLHSMAH